MEITNTATNTQLTDAPAGTNPNGILGKDDFLKLLLVELKYQDPTEPMDSEKILSQTSQLATLEASENTNKALEQLAASMGASTQFNTIAAIGKIADTGSNAIVFEDGSSAEFEMYFPHDVASGSINILDSNGNTVDTIALETSDKGVQNFAWDGIVNGSKVDDGMYYVTASYNDASGATYESRVGTYPIESVRFENGEALAKVGSGYISFDSIKEIYEG
ncbi:MAG: flagellar hook capping FlgD N-terminal domain-containing protein [Campylobacterota bacterium]|nr:flagellar hook capping FlgD N-terminal domain-containing protein [Campylobacterota bacterium]